MLDLTGSLGVGSGYAATLVQVHLGIGLVLLILTSAASSVPALRKQLEGTGWEASVKGAAAAAGPAPLLAVFALIQASSAPSDILTWAGLLASTSAVMLGTLHVMCCPCFGLEMPIVNSRSGAIFCAASANDTRSGACLSMAARMLSSLRACGEVLLVLSSLPVGLQLIAASVLIRLALAIHVLEACAHVLSLQSDGGVLSGKLANAESATAIVPLVGSLALMDYLVSGPSSVLLGFVQPILYSTVLVLMQMGLVTPPPRSLRPIGVIPPPPAPIPAKTAACVFRGHSQFSSARASARQEQQVEEELEEDPCSAPSCTFIHAVQGFITAGAVKRSSLCTNVRGGRTLGGNAWH